MDDSKGIRYSFYTQAGQLAFERINGVNPENYYLGSQLIAYKDYNSVTSNHSDLKGFTAVATNNAVSILKRNCFKSFSKNWGTARSEIGYTSHKFDTDLGLSYMQERYYDPVLGHCYENFLAGKSERLKCYRKYSLVFFWLISIKYFLVNWFERGIALRA